MAVVVDVVVVAVVVVFVAKMFNFSVTRIFYFTQISISGKFPVIFPELYFTDKYGSHSQMNEYTLCTQMSEIGKHLLRRLRFTFGQTLVSLPFL